MDYFKMSSDIKEQFKEEWDETIETLVRRYPRMFKGKIDLVKTEAVFRIIVGNVLVSTLKEIQNDSTKMLATEFQKKYIPNFKLFLDCQDFTSKEIKEIIELAPLNDLEKKLATMFFVEKKNQQEIYMNVDLDKKTISSNLDYISEVLKMTATLYNTKNKQ